MNSNLHSLRLVGTMRSDTLVFEFLQELYTDFNGDLDAYLDHLDKQKSLMEYLNAKFDKILGAECVPTKYVDAKIDIIKALYKL